MSISDTFEGFGHKASELSAYLFASGIFIISLKSGMVVRFSTEKWKEFDEWLRAFNVRDIASS